MYKEFNFSIAGKPIAKQSVKIAKNGIKYTPSNMVNYSNFVKLCFMNKYSKHTPDLLNDCYLEMYIKVYIAVPKSYSNKKHKQCLEQEYRPTTKPDWDNISKNICDALNGVAYPDDKAIVSGNVTKVYAEYDRVDVKLRAFKMPYKEK